MSQNLSPEEQREAIEHRDMLMALRAVLTTGHGRHFIKYLFKEFEVGELPQLGEEGIFLHDKLGFLRAGNAIFKVVAEANADVAGSLLAEIEKDRYAKLYASAQIGAN